MGAALTHQGCGPALTVAGIVGVDALDDDDDDRVDSPPSVSVTSPTGSVNDVIPISYRLTDANNDRASIRVDYKVGNGSYQTAAAALVEGAEGTQNLAAAAAGTEHTFLWNTTNDLGFAQVSDVTVRITPFDAENTSLEGAAVETAAFAVLNEYILSVAERVVPAGLGPTNLAVTSNGSLLLTDTPGSRVARLTRSDGAISVIAGTGTGGFNGGGVLATEAQLNLPYAVAPTSGSGSLDDVLIADTFNARVRRLDSSNAFLVDEAGGGGDLDELILARDAAFAPRDVTVDTEGNLYLLEDRRVRVIHRQGSAAFTLPAGPPGCQLITDLGTTVRSEQVFTLVALAPGCGGPSTSGNHTYTVQSLEDPVAIAVDGTPASGLRLYLLELGPAGGEVAVGAGGVQFPRLRVINLTSSSIMIQTPGGASTITSGGVATAASGNQLPPLGDLADLHLVARDVLLLSTSRDDRVHGINLSGSATSLAGTTVAAGAVTAVIGASGGGLGGDGGGPLAAGLERPLGVTADSAGNVFVSESQGRLRVYAAQALTVGSQTVQAGTVGTLSTVLADTVGGLVAPRAPSLTPAGDVLLTDSQLGDPRSLRVLQVSSADTAVSTVAGSGVFGDRGDGGPAGDARLGTSYHAVTSPNGQVALFSDFNHHRVRAVNLTAQSLTFLNTTIAPGEVETVVGIGQVTTTSAPLGDGGPANQATLNGPTRLGFDAAGLLWVSDSLNHRLRVANPTPQAATVLGVTVAPNQIQTVVGTGAAGTPSADGDGGAAGQALLSSPQLVLDGDLVWVLDGLELGGNTAAPRVRAINRGAAAVTLGGVTIAPGTIATVIGSGQTRAPKDGNLGDGGAALMATFRDPSGIARRADGLAFVSDARDHRVRVVNLSAASVGLGGQTLAAGAIDTLLGTGAPSFTGDPSGAASGYFGSTQTGAIDEPIGVLLLDADRLLFADSGNGALRLFNLGSGSRSFAGVSAGAGELVVVAGSRAGRERLEGPVALDVQSNGLVVFTDRGVLNDRAGVFQIDPVTRGITLLAGTGEQTAGDTSLLGDGGRALLATFDRPSGLELDSEGSLYVCDSGNRRIRFVNRANGDRTPIGGGPTVAPTDIDTVVGGQGDGDTENDDGLAATSAALDLRFPNDVSLANQTLWVVDAEQRVLRIDTGAGTVAGIFSELSLLSSTTSTLSASGSLVDAGVNFTTSDVRKGDQVRITATGNGMVNVDGTPRPVPVTLQVEEVTNATTLDVMANLTGTAFPISYSVVRLDSPTTVEAINTSEAYVGFDSRRLGGGWVGRVVRSGGAFTVTSVVGNSNPEWNGDHLTASTMQLGSVAGLHLLGDVLFVADGDSHRVVAVNVGSAAVSVAGLSIGVGEARMVAGGGQGFGGFNGSAVPPQVALLNQPSSVATTPDGGLYLVDRGNGRIRRFER